MKCALHNKMKILTKRNKIKHTEKALDKRWQSSAFIVK